VINHLQQPRKPTDNSLFSKNRTRVMTRHETTGSLPCRFGGEGFLHSLSPRDIALSDGVNGFPRRPR
jgi:hypothetical protein